MNVFNALEKIAGVSGCFLIVGEVKTAMPEGYAAYAIIVRTDATVIATLDHLIESVPVTLADASWEGKALLRGDLITFEFPVVTITLTAAGDSVFAYLQPTEYVAPPA